MLNMIRRIQVSKFKCLYNCDISLEESENNLSNRAHMIFLGVGLGNSSILEAINLALSNHKYDQCLFPLFRTKKVYIQTISYGTVFDFLFNDFDSIHNTIKISLTFNDSSILDVFIYKPYYMGFNKVRSESLRKYLNRESIVISWNYNNKFLECVYNVSYRYDRYDSWLYSGEITSVCDGTLEKPAVNSVYVNLNEEIDYDRITKMYGEVVIRNNKRTLIASLKELIPHVEDVDVTNFISSQQLSVKFSNGNRYYPITILGSNFQKMILTLVALLSRSNSVILIDGYNDILDYVSGNKYQKLVLSLLENLDNQLIITR